MKRKDQINKRGFLGLKNSLQFGSGGGGPVPQTVARGDREGGGGVRGRGLKGEKNASK